MFFESPKRIFAKMGEYFQFEYYSIKINKSNRHEIL